MTGPASFSRAMALRPDSDPGRFVGELNLNWTIGTKIHGGVMLALCAKAARLAVAGADRELEPVAVSASFLWAPDPGEVQLVTRVRKRGRTVHLVDVELVQGERVAVRAAITLSVTEPEEPLLTVNPLVAGMDAEPPAGIEPIGPGHPLAEINHLASGCDIRPDLSSLWPDPDRSATGTTPLTRIWVRPRDESPDALFALVCGDISMPVTFAVGRTGWAPTVQLTAYLRGMPADGWLRVVASTTQIGQTWFDEDHVVVDCRGRVIVQTRQLALVPAP